MQRGFGKNVFRNRAVFAGKKKHLVEIALTNPGENRIIEPLEEETGRLVHKMKRKFNHASGLAALLAVSVLTAVPVQGADVFTDISGHWAESALETAIEQGWLSGYEDHTMRPDGNITCAQEASILCRLLGLELSPAEEGAAWYAPAVEKATELGFWNAALDPNHAMTRREAFSMLADGLQLYGSNPGETLAGYSDAKNLTEREQLQISGLVESGCVAGFSGSLMLNQPLTRGEFASLLSRMVGENYLTTENRVSDWSGKDLLVCSQDSSVSLHNITAETVVVRSPKVTNLQLSNCKIGTLVLAPESNLYVNAWGVDRVVTGSGSGKLSLSGSAKDVVIASGREVSLQSSLDSCKVLCGSGTVTVGGTVKELTVTGTDNCVKVNGYVGQMYVYGARTTVDGYGSIPKLTLRAPGCEISKRVGELTDETDYGLYGVTAELTHPEKLPAGEELVVTAALSETRPNLHCKAIWKVDGKVVDTQNVTTTGTDTVTLKYKYQYKRWMSLNSKIEFALEYTTEYGEKQSVTAECNQLLENYPDEYLYKLEKERVLALVTDTYAGDYTLEWAETHDYTKEDKEFWVNCQWYSSSSQYLIWINQTYQRVNIFEGSAGNWKLIRSCIVGCGKDSTPTPRGVCKTTYKQTGWFQSSYQVLPVVRFYGGGYAFHSRLYYPRSTTLQDPSIGFPVSHGCVRMYDEDIQWIYDNVPDGTTVVSH